MRGWCETRGCGWRGSYRMTVYAMDEHGHERPLTYWRCIGCYQKLPRDEKERWTYRPPPGDEVEMLNRYMSSAHADPTLQDPSGQEDDDG